MGLVFPVHPDLKRSRGSTLILSSTTKKFSIGGSLLFLGLVLAAMYLATAPLFEIMWNQGGLFDKILVGFFYSLIYIYPFATLICWFYKEKLVLRKLEDGSFLLRSELRIGPIPLRTQESSSLGLEDLDVQNWRGSVNIAAIESGSKSKSSKSPEKARKARYATKGHWVLLLQSNPQFTLEKRARREDIDWLKAQIEAYFS